MTRSSTHHVGPIAYTLVEVVVSALVISLMLVAALETVAVARVGMHRVSVQTRGMLLAEDLLSEIMVKEYADPDYGWASFGVGGDEDIGNRSKFDDVDDYDDWRSAPPTLPDGTVIPGADEFARQVAVVWVDPTKPAVDAGAATSVKRITVIVYYDKAPVAELVALRTDAWTAPPQLLTDVEAVPIEFDRWPDETKKLAELADPNRLVAEWWDTLP